MGVRLDILNKFISFTGYSIVRNDRLLDYFLYEYDSYEDYRETQIKFNKLKLDYVWADEKTLSIVGDFIVEKNGNNNISALCHGSRNGFEQGFFNKVYQFDAIGTDISPTANQFDSTVEWDFHDVNDDWISKFDFVYSNSLDQSWNPKKALSTWLGQVKNEGLVVLEFTEKHGPMGVSIMDPFGVRPIALPYVLHEWFADSVTISIVKSTKENKNNMDVWMFFIKKLYDIGDVK